MSRGAGLRRREEIGSGETRAAAWLPPGYALDESDPDLMLLRRADGSEVAVLGATGATREGITRGVERDVERDAERDRDARAAANGGIRRRDPTKETPRVDERQKETPAVRRGVGGPRRMRVPLADDRFLLGRTVAEVLGAGDEVEIVGRSDGEGAAVAAEGGRPDVMILEVGAPAERASEAVSRLLALSYPSKVVVLTRHEDPRLLRAVLEAGASACVHKGASFGDLLAAVRAAAWAATRGPAAAIFLAMPRGVLERAETDGSHGPLSARELEVLILAARGISNRRIARSLHISEATVKRHLTRAYPKLGATCRGEAVSKALAAGWISAYDIAAGDEGV